MDYFTLLSQLASSFHFLLSSKRLNTPLFHAHLCFSSKMRMDYWKQKFPFNHRNLFLKLLLTIFFLGLAFRILFFHSLSPQISSVLESPFPEKVTLPEEPQTSPVPEEEPVPEPPLVIEHVPQTEDQLSPTDSGECCWVLIF